MAIAVIVVFSVMTITSLVLYAIDKMRSEKYGWRIPEIVLIVVSALGGVLGTIIGMIAFNHKSNMSHKWYFFFTIVASFIVQLFIGLLAFGVIVL